MCVCVCVCVCVVTLGCPGQTLAAYHKLSDTGATYWVSWCTQLSRAYSCPVHTAVPWTQLSRANGCPVHTAVPCTAVPWTHLTVQFNARHSVLLSSVTPSIPPSLSLTSHTVHNNLPGKPMYVSRSVEACSWSHCCSGRQWVLYNLSVCVCGLKYPACNEHAPCCHLWPAPLYIIFPHYLIKGAIFERKLPKTKCVLWYRICRKHFSF